MLSFSTYYAEGPNPVPNANINTIPVNLCGFMNNITVHQFITERDS